MEWNKYPYTDFHELNLDFIIKDVAELKEEVENISTDVDDSKISTSSVWSSYKTNSEIQQNKITVDSSLSDISENPVQNKVVKAAIDAEHVTIDSSLSDTSENPVQNKVVKAAIDNITIPIATTTAAGKVKPDGATITVDLDGTIHSVGGGGGDVPIATTSLPGKVKPDGDTIGVDSDGSIHALNLKITDGTILSGDTIYTKLSDIETVENNIVGGDVWTTTHISPTLRTGYDKGETCIYNNVAYVALQNTDSSILPTNTTYWSPISLKELNSNINDNIKVETYNAVITEELQTDWYEVRIKVTKTTLDFFAMFHTKENVPMASDLYLGYINGYVVPRYVEIWTNYIIDRNSIQGCVVFLHPESANNRTRVRMVPSTSDLPNSAIPRISCVTIL